MAHDGLDTQGKIDVPDPTAGKVDQTIPIAREGELIDDADDAIVVVFDFAVETLATVEYERFKRLDDRWPLIANVGGGGVFHAGLRDGAGADGLLQQVEPELFAHVELDQHKYKSAEDRLVRIQIIDRHLTHECYCI